MKPAVFLGRPSLLGVLWLVTLTLAGTGLAAADVHRTAVMILRIMWLYLITGMRG